MSQKTYIAVIRFHNGEMLMLREASAALFVRAGVAVWVA